MEKDSSALPGHADFSERPGAAPDPILQNRAEDPVGVKEAATVLPKIRNVPSYQEVYNVIEAEILAKRLRPGDLLPTEAALAETLGVNRSTVREGIRLLEQTGLVIRKAGRRLYVSRPRYAEMSTRLSRALVMHQVAFRELWEVTQALEPLAARLAAQRIDQADLQELERNVIATEQAAALGQSLIILDGEFHSIVAQATHNRALMLAREPVGLLIYPATDRMMALVPQSPRRLVQAHRAVFQAIAAGNAELAEQWMRRHIADFRRGYEIAGLDMERPVESPPDPL